MPTCFTVSTLSPTHLFKFQVRFQAASRDWANQGMWVQCSSWKGHWCHRQLFVLKQHRRACSQPRAGALSWERQAEGWEENLFFWVVFPPVPQNQPSPGSWWVLSERRGTWFQLELEGALVVHPPSPPVCPCVLEKGDFPGLICQHGWYSYNKHSC